MQLILESQITQKMQLYKDNIDAMSPIISFSRAERLFDCAGRGDIFLSETSPDGLEVRSAWQGPDGPSTSSAPFWKTWICLGIYGKHQTQEAERAQNAATCAVIQIWPLIYSIHPNKHHATLQETKTRDLKMRALRTCTCCPSPYHKTMLWFMPKWKAEAVKRVSDGVL